MTLLSIAMKLPAPLLPLFLVCTPAALPAQAAENAQASVVPVALASPVDGTVEQLLAAARELLLDERPEEALVWFEQAAEADSHSFRTRLWVLRAWMDLGRSNDTLDAIDELSRSGETGPELDYLYGMAFARRAQGHIAAGVTDSSVQMNFIDAVDQLQSAVNAAPQRFSDAYLALAESAWYVQDLEVARDAAEQAVRYHPEQGRAWLQLGKVAMSQFRTAQGVEAWGDQAGAHWSRAHAAFERAVEVLGRPVDRPARQARLADAALQLGHARVWKQRVPQAADAYAVAIGWSPATQDYSTLYNLLQPPQPATSAAGAPGPSAPSRPNSGAPSEAAPEPLPAATYFHRALEEGTRRFQETFGPDDPRDAGLLWWLGWARGAMGRPADAEQAYLASLAKEPAYVNAWFQVALARFAQGV